MAAGKVRAIAAILVVFWLSWAMSPSSARAQAEVFRAGAAVVDITPKQLPVIVSGGFLQGRANRVNDPLRARCLALSDGTTTIAIAVADTLFMPREFVDEVKQRVSKSTGIPTDRLLISATHTHSAPSVAGALGTGVEESYVPVLREGVARCIEAAMKNMAPAQVGWATIVDNEHTNCRRWIYRPDRMLSDPFGQRSARANMHPGYVNPACVGPAGPKDPGLSVLAVRSPGGRPIAVLANYSMHYYGAPAVSADYYGRFCEKLARLIAGDKAAAPVVTIISQGTAGDLHWMDYSRPAHPPGIDRYAQEVAETAFKAFRAVQYHDWVPLAMAERTLMLRRRTPDAQRLAWARQIIDKMKPRTLPSSITEVYALEQVYLANEPQRELKLQAVRIGDLGITAIPDEVFGITGLKLKAQSPLRPTFNIELANGEEGYIPPPEQHFLGGYTTWPARSAGLEVQAEPKIVETLLELLEQVSGKPRRPFAEVHGPYAQAVLASKPLAYWRMGEFVGPQAGDSSGQNHPAVYEQGVAFYLEGPEGEGFCGPGHVNRAPHFAGGRMKAALPSPGSCYSVELWFWNGLPADARPVTGYLFSCGPAGASQAGGEHLAIAGSGPAAGKLLFHTGSSATEALTGSAAVALKTWTHLVLARDGRKVTVYVNGRSAAELSGQTAVGPPDGSVQVFVGGRADNVANFEGKIDEVAIYGRALDADEIAKHFAAAGMKQ